MKTSVKTCEVSEATAEKRREVYPGFQGQQAKPPAAHCFTCGGNIIVTGHSCSVLTPAGGSRKHTTYQLCSLKGGMFMWLTCWA